MDVAANGPTARLPVAPGDVLAQRYLLGPVIGEGGMGVVIAAQHIGLDVPVAVKLIRTEYKDDTEFVVRFVNEARAAASLKGAHIARVYDVGQLDTGEPYLVMERLEGIALEEFMQARGPLDIPEAAAIVLEVCEGLAEAHAIGLVHRDIKPANLFLARRPDGRSIVKILDFGIAKRLENRGAACITGPERSLGSPWYMSPEQMVDPSRVDQRTDLWSLGVLLFELLTHNHPFDGRSVPEVCAKVLSMRPPPLSTWRDDVDATLEAVVARCLEKDPDHRFASVAELAEQLLDYAPGYVPFERGRSSAPWLSGRLGGRSSSGTLAPLGHHRVRNQAAPRYAAALGMLAVAGSVAWFSYAAARAGVPPKLDLETLSRLHLPGDPTLEPGPEPTPYELTIGSREPLVVPIGGFGAARAAPEPERR